MKTTPKRITARTIESAKPRARKYRLAVGDGLAIIIHSNGGKYWIRRYRRPANGKAAELNIGAYPAVSLAQAKEANFAASQKLRESMDPGAARKAGRQTGDHSYEAMAREAIEKIAQDWSSSEHRARQESHMERHIYPWIGHLPADQVSAPEVTRTLDRLAQAGKTATARKLKSLIG